MDGLLALGILALIALPIMAISAFLMVLGARQRISVLERKMALLEGAGIVVPAAPQPGTEAASPAPGVPEAQPEPEPVPMLEAPAGPPEAIEPAALPVPAKPRESLEERLGARWAVWVGGLALALGAVFLVRYSIEAGLLGPGVRIVLGALFSLALLGAGEWLRRSERAVGFGALPAASIPGVLTAAGTVGLFAVVWSAHGLYGMIGPGTAFVLLGAIGIGTMAAAALHGPWLSGLGLVGAYATPLLVSSAEPNVPALMVYLLVVTAAAYALARLRRWRWLAIAASVAAILWGFAMLLLAGGSPLSSAIYALALLGLVAVFLVVDVHRGAEGSPERDGFASIVLVLVAALLVAGAAASHFDMLAVLAALAGGAVLLAIGRAYEPVSAAAPIASALAVALLYLWPAASQALAEPTTIVADAMAGYFPLPETIRSFGAIALFVVVAVILGNGTALFARPAKGAYATTMLAAAATAGPVLVAIVAYLRIAGFVSNVAFAALTLVLAAAFAALTDRFMRRESEAEPQIATATGIFAAGSIAALAAALTMALEGGMLTTAFALAALGAAWVGTKRPIPALRYGAAALAFLVLARVAWDPYIFAIRAGGGIYLSILAGYGIPAAAFALAARLLRGVRVDRALYAVEALAVIMSALLVIFEIRAVVFDGNLLNPAPVLADQGLTAAAAFTFALGLARLSRQSPSPVFRIGAILARIAGLAAAVISLGVIVNPLVTGAAVSGGPVFNDILLAYGLPAALAALLAWSDRSSPDETRSKHLSRATGIVALLLAFAAITLEIRFLFAGPGDLTIAPVGSAESYAYSAGWLLLGLVLLFGGLLFGLRAARIGSAVLIVLTVVKVFLFDMSNLEGIWRALSFMGLGAALIGIGLLYQKLLFVRPQAEDPPLPPAGEESTG